MQSTLKFEINGEQKEIPAGNICDILTYLKITDTAGLAVAINNQVIPKSNWTQSYPINGDKILLVSATQGG